MVQDGNSTKLFGAGSPECLPAIQPSPIGILTNFEQLDWSTAAANCTEQPTITNELQLVDIAASWNASFCLLAEVGSSRKSAMLAWSDVQNEAGRLSSVQTIPYGARQLSAPVEDGEVRRIFSGPRHFAALLETGRLYGWGNNRQQQLGSSGDADIDTRARMIAENVRSAALGQHHTVVLDQTDNISSFGSNKKGQLGSLEAKDTAHTVEKRALGLSIDASFTSVHATWTSTFVLAEDEDGTRLFSFGNNAFGQLGRATSVLSALGEVRIGVDLHRNIRSLGVGSEHALALVDSNEETQVWGWGWNEHGNLGLGEHGMENQPLPVKVWSAGDFSGSVHSVHAGNGTSWIATLEWFVQV